MTILIFIIVFCSFFGPVGLCLALFSPYAYTRVIFGMIACLCAFLMGFAFGTTFGASILSEIMMWLMPMSPGGNI